MLVLTAVSASDRLNLLVPQAEYHRLLKSTITFLRQLAPISSTCSVDCDILEKLDSIVTL